MSMYVNADKKLNVFAIVRDGVIALVVLLLLQAFWPFRSVPTGTRGVITQFGAIKGIENEGLLFVPPWKNLTIFNIRAEEATVEDAEGTLDLSGKVDVARSIDDVDANVLPGAGRRSRGNRDAALLLLLHPVHGRSALVHLADTVRDARIEEDALGRRRLAGVDVRHDSDVPATIQRCSACHGLSLICEHSLAVKITLNLKSKDVY